jgi:hypothetical protein
MTEPKKSFVTRCMAFFGRQQGQNISEFKKELDELTMTDKHELVGLFNEAGMPTLPPVEKK